MLFGVELVEEVAAVELVEEDEVELAAVEEADGAAFEASDFEVSVEVDFAAAAGAEPVEDDFAASLAKAGAATNAITAKASKNFFMCFSK